MFICQFIRCQIYTFIHNANDRLPTKAKRILSHALTRMVSTEINNFQNVIFWLWHGLMLQIQFLILPQRISREFILRYLFITSCCIIYRVGRVTDDSKKQDFLFLTSSVYEYNFVFTTFYHIHLQVCCFDLRAGFPAQIRTAYCGLMCMIVKCHFL